jgi:F-type H+-transporting ATPase subunit epsilon
MSQDLQLDIVTPFGKKYSNSIRSCRIPGIEGQFQVLKEHAAIISVVDVGLIIVEEQDGKKLILASSDGYCEVNKNRIKVIVEAAEFANDIDLNRAELASKRAMQRLAEKTEKVDVARAKLALARAANRIRVARHR